MGTTVTNRILFPPMNFFIPVTNPLEPSLDLMDLCIWPAGIRSGSKGAFRGHKERDRRTRPHFKLHSDKMKIKNVLELKESHVVPFLQWIQETVPTAKYYPQSNLS